ncbi:hypothetical protein SNEBB_003443 [Seison nebaliae]|nr:hypothetical protein SNEBB_003443 [Seison nebaliae]
MDKKDLDELQSLILAEREKNKNGFEYELIFDDLGRQPIISDAPKILRKFWKSSQLQQSYGSHKCPVCIAYTFPSLLCLWQHLIYGKCSGVVEHREITGNHFQCVTCGMAYSSITNLRVHLKTAITCNYSFISKDSIETNRKTTTTEIKEELGTQFNERNGTSIRRSTRKRTEKKLTDIYELNELEEMNDEKKKDDYNDEYIMESENSIESDDDDDEDEDDESNEDELEDDGEKSDTKFKEKKNSKKQFKTSKIIDMDQLLMERGISSIDEYENELDRENLKKIKMMVKHSCHKDQVTNRNNTFIGYNYYLEVLERTRKMLRQLLIIENEEDLPKYLKMNEEQIDGYYFQVNDQELREFFKKCPNSIPICMGKEEIQLNLFEHHQLDKNIEMAYCGGRVLAFDLLSTSILNESILIVLSTNEQSDNINLYFPKSLGIFYGNDGTFREGDQFKCIQIPFMLSIYQLNENKFKLINSFLLPSRGYPTQLKCLQRFSIKNSFDDNEFSHICFAVSFLHHSVSLHGNFSKNITRQSTIDDSGDIRLYRLDYNRLTEFKRLKKSSQSFDDVISFSAYRISHSVLSIEWNVIQSSLLVGSYGDGRIALWNLEKSNCFPYKVLDIFSDPFPIIGLRFYQPFIHFPSELPKHQLILMSSLHGMEVNLVEIEYISNDPSLSLFDGLYRFPVSVNYELNPKFSMTRISSAISGKFSAAHCYQPEITHSIIHPKNKTVNLNQNLEYVDHLRCNDSFMNLVDELCYSTTNYPSFKEQWEKDKQIFAISSGKLLNFTHRRIFDRLTKEEAKRLILAITISAYPLSLLTTTITGEIYLTEFKRFPIFQTGRSVMNISNRILSIKLRKKINCRISSKNTAEEITSSEPFDTTPIIEASEDPEMFRDSDVDGEDEEFMKISKIRREEATLLIETNKQLSGISTEELELTFDQFLEGSWNRMSIVATDQFNFILSTSKDSTRYLHLGKTVRRIENQIPNVNLLKFHRSLLMSRTVHVIGGDAGIIFRLTTLTE